MSGAAGNLPEMPNAPIMELHGQRKRFHIPYKLKPLMEDMAREVYFGNTSQPAQNTNFNPFLQVLRFEPDNIYEFLAKYLEEKVKKEKEQPAEKITVREKSKCIICSYFLHSILTNYLFKILYCRTRLV